MTDLGSIGDLDSTADDINDSGLIVGFASDHVGDSRIAIEWQSGKLITLGTFGAPAAQAVAVNRAGDVLIQTQTVGGNPKGGFLLRGGRTLTIPTFGRGPIVVTGLDDLGNVLGYGTARKGDARSCGANGHTALLADDRRRREHLGRAKRDRQRLRRRRRVRPLPNGHSISHAVLWRKR